MSVIKFSSNAEELRYFMEQLLEDGKVHSIQEIKEYVEGHSSHYEDFTEGMYSGAIRSLVQNSKGKYAGVARGKYQLVNSAEDSDTEIRLQENVLQMLDDFCEKLESACTINLMNVDERDLKVAQKTAEIISILEKKKREIERLR
ncbi:MAG: hypothetical protein J5986_09475 [Roseburia sp.]|nr:hypothetical protein [Roseburia sp.]